jgi:predicted GNAT family acetyltransferase
VRLGDADAADMLDLTRRTEPGPFKVRTHTMGNYIGLRDGGKLIAMAGERLRIGGYVEISTVCVDDAYRGRGIANRLIRILQNEIGQRGQTPFLHVLDHNSGAFGLYERMGFERRQSFHLTRLQRQEPA